MNFFVQVFSFFLFHLFLVRNILEMSNAKKYFKSMQKSSLEISVSCLKKMETNKTYYNIW